jgi:hypothetical protein
MAGDIDRRERLIVLADTTDGTGDETSSLIQEAGSQTVHQYGQRLLVADVPYEFDERVEHAVAIAPSPGHLAATASMVGAMADGLDAPEAMGLAAFELRTSDAYGEAKAARPHADEPWAQPDGEVQPPDVVDAEALEADEREAGGLQAATSSRLTGSVAVGVIIVDGPTAALKFTAAERVKVVAEVQNGLGWLGAQSSPTGIRWVYDVRVVSITARPQSSDDTLAKKEARFRDPALKEMGFGTGLSGAQAYVDALRKSKQTNWAYCAFFTKYPVGHFAYASLGGPRLVMHYDNDGWGPDNIDRVFAHETGHIFRAPDEYASSGCSCSAKFGHFNVVNGNCDPCAPGGGVACIMKSNSWAMCSYTPYHLGFPQGARYTGVFVAGTGAHGLWANASWTPFVQKWQQWSAQGLRLVDLDVAQIGSQHRYSGAFRAGSGPYGLWAMSDWSSFLTKWQQWSGQGMRLVDIEVTRVGTQTRYSGVFRQGSGAYGLWALADWNSFVTKWQQWSAQGMRLIDMDVVMVGSSPRYSGVFVAGSGAHALWALADWSSFRSKWQQLSSQGQRLVDIERTRVGNQTRFSGVFRQGAGGYGLWTGASWNSFREKWEEWNKAGLRLVDVSMDPTDIETVTASEAGGPEAAGDLEGLIGFGGAPMPPAVAEGVEAPGEGMVDLTKDAADEEADVGVGAVSLDPEVAPSPLGMAGNGHVGDGRGPTIDSPAGAGGMSLIDTPIPEPAEAAAAAPGQGDVVTDVADDVGVPPLTGIGMASDG